ncbi:hypothetical protein AMTRI_Chr04g249140 [Amborella trichopoda]
MSVNLTHLHHMRLSLSHRCCTRSILSISLTCTISGEPVGRHMLQHQVWSFSLLYFSVLALDLPLSHSPSLFRSSLLVKALALSLCSGFLSLTALDLPLSALFLSLSRLGHWPPLSLFSSFSALVLSLSFSLC